MPLEAMSIVASKLAGLGLAAKLGVAATVGTAGVAGAGAAGALPDQANERARDAIESVTPLEFDEPAADHGDNFGSTVSGDATGESDGEPGVDGSEISEMAPGAANRPDDPGQAPARPGPAEGAGLDQATDTPAATVLPEDAGKPQTPPSTDPVLPDDAGKPQAPPSAAPDVAETAPGTVPAVGGPPDGGPPDGGGPAAQAG